MSLLLVLISATRVPFLLDSSDYELPYVSLASIYALDSLSLISANTLLNTSA